MVTEEEYQQQLHDIKQRVAERPLLFERLDMNNKRQLAQGEKKLFTQSIACQ